jgi:hypothetical protein
MPPLSSSRLRQHRYCLQVDAVDAAAAAGGATDAAAAAAAARAVALNVKPASAASRTLPSSVACVMATVAVARQHQVGLLCFFEPQP